MSLPRERLWNPPERTGRRLRHARVKVIGSAAIFLVVSLALVLSMI